MRPIPMMCCNGIRDARWSTSAVNARILDVVDRRDEDEPHPRDSENEGSELFGIARLGLATSGRGQGSDDASLITARQALLAHELLRGEPSLAVRLAQRVEQRVELTVEDLRRGCAT